MSCVDYVLSPVDVDFLARIIHLGLRGIFTLVCCLRQCFFWIAVVCCSVARLAHIRIDYVFVYHIFRVSVSGQRSLSIFLFSCAR
jgi:hypothetical protein